MAYNPETQKAYYQRNREEILRKRKIYREKNKEARNAYNKAFIHALRGEDMVRRKVKNQKNVARN